MITGQSIWQGNGWSATNGQDALDKGMTDVLGRTEQDSKRFPHATQKVSNLKLKRVVSHLTTGNETTKSKTKDKGRIPLNAY